MLLASSIAFCTMPVPRSAAGVSTTFAPRKRISLRRSTLKRLGHRDDERIALLRAHHREPDAGVAARRLDHGLAGLELAAALGVFDDAEREAVLHRAERVERLDLDVQVDAGGASLLIRTTGVLPTVSRMLANRVIYAGSMWLDRER